MKKWLAILLALAILAFVFADSLSYMAGRWQEKTGRVKRAVRIYTWLIKTCPRSWWVKRAKKAVERLEKSRGKRKRGEVKVGEPVAPYIGVLKKAETKVKAIEEEKEKEYGKWLNE